MEVRRQHGCLGQRGWRWMKGSEGRSWYWGQHTGTCLVALYSGLNIVSAGVDDIMAGIPVVPAFSSMSLAACGGGMKSGSMSSMGSGV